MPIAPPPAPIDVNTWRISGIVRVIASTCSTVLRVSSSVLPGAISIDKRVCERSLADMKLVGSNETSASEPRKKPVDAIMTKRRCCSDHAATPTYQSSRRLFSGAPLWCVRKRAASIGVISRATVSDASTATTAVQPNCLKMSPGMPLIIAVGRNTATSVMLVAMTARPISVAASIAACNGGLPPRKCRTMFSTSTMASSTSNPMTSDSASSVTVFIEKPSQYIAANVGMIDNGKAEADTSVARQSRRNSQTTAIARIAPSHSMFIDAVYSLRIMFTESLTSVKLTPGCAAPSASIAFVTASATATALVPRERWICTVTTGLPSSSASCERSATVSVIVAIWSSRMWRPSGNEMSSAFRSPARFTVASVRIDWRESPISPRPPDSCCWMRRS